MTYRETRNFCEIMRSLGYPRIISMENFRIPNFKLVAEIIFWLIHRFDPKAEIPESIDEEKDRVEFICAACKFFYSNLKLKLNLKKIYQSDSYCVPELLKVAEILYQAKRTLNHSDEIDFSSELDITTRQKEIKEVKELSSSIVETGLNLLDLLDKEKMLKSSRDKALEFLDNLTKGGESKKEQEQVEKRIISILQQQQDTIEQLDSHVNQLRATESELDEEIKLKNLEAERSEKKLAGISSYKPSNNSEQFQLENDLSQMYRIYVEKLRNHDYMESKLDEYHQIDLEIESGLRKGLYNIGKKNKEKFNDLINDNNEGIEDRDEQYNYVAEEARMKNVSIIFIIMINIYYYN